jgi:demethylmenaquinone methyltransferase/2-methoxy-6-polyprenyl-1,4-benzoquinol methylase
MAVWKEVEDTLEGIIDDYERVNHFISLFQDEKIRIEGLSKIGQITGVSLELGPGPGNFSSSILGFVRSHLICLDYSNVMLSAAKDRLKNEDVNFIRGTFENIPIRGNVIAFTSLAFALRDSLYKLRVLTEIKKVLNASGKLLVVDIGKPNNKVSRSFFTLYMKYVVPLISGLTTKYGYRNPWRLLYKTYVRLPENTQLLRLTENVFGEAIMKEKALGSLVFLIAENTAV